MSLEKHIRKYKNEFDTETMSKTSDKLFERRLQKSLHKKPKFTSQPWRFAAAAAILVVSAIILWNQHQNFQEEIFKQEILAQLQNESSGKRLEALYNLNDNFKKEDDQMINALVKTLLNDNNLNVKIAAIDALLQFPKNEFIRKNLIKAIEKEKEPMVQIKLIKSLKILREKRAKEPLENIINNEETYPIVKNNAALAMSEINQIEK